MRDLRCCVAGVLVAAVLHVHAPRLHAQASGTRRVAFDTVVGVQDLFRETRDWPTSLVVDPFVSAEVRRHLQATVRPKLWRVNGEWEFLLDQASVEYTFQAGANWRLEAGRFPSMVGLGMTENRPNINGGVLWWHRPYYMPLPRMGPSAPMVSLVSAVYPTGVAVSTSSSVWDLRAALVDTSPVQFWHGDAGTDRKANVVLGAGVTPRQGLRLGVATARGDLTDAPNSGYRLINVEGDYSFGYTRISGEATRDTFAMPGGGDDYVAWGWTLQARQTLSPRLFVHARATGIQSPVPTGPESRRNLTYRSIDSTLGYLIDPEVTLRLGYSALASWGTSAVDHQVGVSVMWSRRWW